MIPVFEEAGLKLVDWWLNQLSVSSEKQRVVLDAQNDLSRTVSNTCEFSYCGYHINKATKYS